MHEIPLAQVVKRVLEASEIGEYVRSEVAT
jgi:hypothetical protein